MRMCHRDHLLTNNMQPSMDLAHRSSHPQPTTRNQIGDAQTNNEGSDTMASPSPPENAILRLPYELLLAIFCQLPDRRSVAALARTHPTFGAVLRSNQLSIRKAILGNTMVKIAKSGTGYESQYLMKVFWMVVCRMKTKESFETLSAIFSGSWFTSPEELFRAERWFQHRAEKRIRYLTKFSDIVGELEFFGWFAQASNPHRWHKRRFCPVASWAYKRNSRHVGAFNYRTPKLKNIELLMVIDLWCAATTRASDTPPSVAAFMSIFTQDIAQRAKQFARCYVEGKKETQK
ncbi:hypothetical protein F5B21DRAFT_194260 [Xylaria acuta]|nr:hypothetical protein F5B21DRAFT_194260 [Xylaria acuta]